MPLQRAEVGHPHQRRRLVDDEVGRRLARVGLRVVPTCEPLRRVLWQLLVPEPLGWSRRSGSGACSAGDRRGRAAQPARSALRTGRARAWSPVTPVPARGRAPCRGWSAASVRPKTSHLPFGPSASRAASSSALRSATTCGRRAIDASAAGRSERHIRSGSAWTSSFVRPLSTDRGCSSGSQPSTACSSRLCTSSHCSRSPRAPGLCGRGGPAPADRAASARGPRRAAHPRRPLPRGRPCRAVPTCPRPTRSRHRRRTRPRGITPSKSKYSIGWSSTWTAVRFARGSKRRAPRHGPTDQHAVDLEPEVVVEAPGAMPLHDEPRFPVRTHRSSALQTGHRLSDTPGESDNLVTLDHESGFGGSSPATSKQETMRW